MRIRDNFRNLVLDNDRLKSEQARLSKQINDLSEKSNDFIRCINDSVSKDGKQEGAVIY